jgi:hypothetical protein
MARARDAPGTAGAGAQGGIDVAVMALRGRLEEVRHHVRADLLPQGQAALDVPGPVDAGIDSALAHLLRRRREAAERLDHARRRGRAERERDVVRAEERRQGNGRRSGEAAMGRDVRRVVGRHEQRRPGRVAGGGEIAVRIAVLDGRDRAPARSPRGRGDAVRERFERCSILGSLSSD